VSHCSGRGDRNSCELLQSRQRAGGAGVQEQLGACPPRGMPFSFAASGAAPSVSGPAPSCRRCRRALRRRAARDSAPISMPTYVRAVALAEQYCSASGQRRLCHTVQVEQVGSCWQKCQENTSPNNQNSFNSAYPIIVPHFTCKLNVGVRGACQQNYTVLYRR